MLKAVRHHTDSPWVLLYIERWLRAPVQMGDGSIVERTAGTPQGGVISPLLANLFLHYAFDTWMVREFPHIPFERYADDMICHCRTEEEAQALSRAIADRFAACKLVLHPEKTKIVYCKDVNRRGGYPRHDWLMRVVEKRLREELAELLVEINEEKSRTVDLSQGESFGFLGFDFRRIRSRRGAWRAH